MQPLRIDLFLPRFSIPVITPITHTTLTDGADTMNKAVYIAPEDQDEVDLGWMREALVMVSVSSFGGRCLLRLPARRGGAHVFLPQMQIARTARRLLDLS